MVDDGNEQKRLRDALHAAQLYYQQDLTMEAIGAELRVSRSSVSRLLQLARDSGIVDIRVHQPTDEPRRIERALRERFGVRGYLVPVPERVSHIERLERVTRTAARMLGEFFRSNMIMGVVVVYWIKPQEVRGKFDILLIRSSANCSKNPGFC